ncbi:hypothetical protein [Pseudomonas syringae]|uniref:hypothetical protein n=1 Tax=Pseudomonas syringae TaxID=317 RepID=UPI0015C5F4D1|nr:hypothetical protein [Pseudomonas syringae]
MLGKRHLVTNEFYYLTTTWRGPLLKPLTKEVVLIKKQFNGQVGVSAFAPWLSIWLENLPFQYVDIRDWQQQSIMRFALELFDKPL